jgi:hypothetical protein
MVSWDKPGKHTDKTPEGEPIFARVSLSELTLAEARSVVDDASWFDETRMPILFWFHVPVDEYEALTVGTHSEMVQFLKLRGVVDGDK